MLETFLHFILSESNKTKNSILYTMIPLRQKIPENANYSSVTKQLSYNEWGVAGQRDYLYRDMNPFVWVMDTHSLLWL